MTGLPVGRGRGRRLASAGESARALMVRHQLVARGIRDPRVLDAMARVPRELFVPAELQSQAYEDHPLPLAGGQTISQPYVVARMAEEAGIRPADRILDVGTGSGYQAAVLAAMGAQVYSMERDAALHEHARRCLAGSGLPQVELRHGDGHLGWPEAAPFAAILVAAVASQVPPALVQQLAEGGRLVMPLHRPGDEEVLMRVQRQGESCSETRLLPVRFVPLQPGVR